MKNTTIKTSALSAILLISSFNLEAAEEAKSSQWSGNISGYIGAKSLKEKDWNTLDSQGSLGVLFDIKKKSWPVSLAFDVIVSGDVNKTDSLKETGGTVEYDLGVRKIFDINGSKFKPYIGGGVAVIFADIKIESDTTLFKKKKDATGAWVGVGAYYEITPKLNLGMDVRYSKAHTKLIDEKREIGGLNAGLTFGYRF